MAADDEYLQTQLELLVNLIVNETDKDPRKDDALMREIMDFARALRVVKKFRNRINNKLGVNINSRLTTYLGL